MNNFTIGQRVECNGYKGTIVKVHAGQLAGMFDVRVPGGVTCVCRSDVKPWTDQQVDIFGRVRTPNDLRFIADLRNDDPADYRCEICGEPAGEGGALCPVHLEMCK